MEATPKSTFQLDPAIHFLNHGSFGACPIPVFEIYQAWQRRLERQPVLFLGREIAALDREARQAMGAYLGTAAENLVFVPNTTHGVNIIARSLALSPGDEILTSDHEYGACDNTWEFICRKTGASYIHRPIPLPVNSSEEMVEQFWAGVTPRTRLIYLSHITSPTALRLPVEAICQRARRAGILTLIDGAHAPGQIPLDLDAIGADWYTGNCHKWMLSPKGAGFLHARPEVQGLVEPLVVSWGYQATPQTSSGSQFLDYLGWTGTKDPAAALSVPAAIQFMKEHDWEQVQQACQEHLRPTLERICELTEMEPLYPLDSELYRQMAIAPLPPDIDTGALKSRLYSEYRVEVPIIEWNGRKFVRISVQAYNTEEDLEALITGLSQLLPELNRA
jgi:isopenicillin-N epimerase